MRERYRLSRPGWVLIQPDLAIAARSDGGDLAGLNHYPDRVVRRLQRRPRPRAAPRA